MRKIRPRLVTLCGLIALALAPGAGLAQGSGTYTVGLLAGLGGSLEDEPDTGLDNLSWQALFTMKIDSGTQWGVRAGQLDLETALAESSLDYLTISGEYLFGEDLLDTGLYLGLGLYNFDGFAPSSDDTAIGLTVGLSGDITITERFSVLIDLSAHYADLDQTQFFVIGLVGVGYHF